MRAELSAAVSAVIESGGLSPVYQPIVHLPTGRILGYEGLVRVSPDSGFPHTGALFDAAEVAGRVLELDRAALDAVLRGAHGLAEQTILSLNVSPRSFEAPEFNATVVLAILRRHGVSPDRVLLELTERDAIRDPDRLRTAIHQLQDAGVRVAADDVGAGNAGLRLLSQFRFDAVKIDLSLVQGGAEPGPDAVRPDLARRARPALGSADDRRGRRDGGAAPDDPPARHRRRPGLPARAARRHPRRGSSGPGCARGRPGAGPARRAAPADDWHPGRRASPVRPRLGVRRPDRRRWTGPGAGGTVPTAASIIAGGAPNPFASR